MALEPIPMRNNSSLYWDAPDRVEAVLGEIVHLAVEELEGCDHAGISLVQCRRLTSPAWTDDLPKTVGRIQEVVGEGPCLDVIKTHQVAQVDDLSAEERWPEFSTRAHQATGVRSILSLRIFVEEDTMGALSLYSIRSGAFDGTDIAGASVFAACAALALQPAWRAPRVSTTSGRSGPRRTKSVGGAQSRGRGPSSTSCRSSNA